MSVIAGHLIVGQTCTRAPPPSRPNGEITCYNPLELNRRHTTYPTKASIPQAEGILLILRLTCPHKFLLTGARSNEPLQDPSWNQWFAR